MLTHELIDFINNNKFEDGHIEFKSANKGFPKIYDTLSSFSNSKGGGIIVFGIDETNHDICGVYDAKNIQIQISNACLQMNPEVRAICTVAQIKDKIVVSAEICEIEISKRPCYYKGAGIIQGSYIRVGDNDRKMTQYEIYSFQAYRENIKDELRVVPIANLEDIDNSVLKNYLMKLNIDKPHFSQLSLEKKLTLQGFMKGCVPTIAGVMMFSEFAQSFFPQLCITAVVVEGFEIGETSSTGARFIDNKKIEGTLPQMLNGAMNFIRRNMSIETIIDPTTGIRTDKTQYPVVALREIILNALIHRDYSSYTENSPITIVMYKDRIEIENPGGLYGRITVDTLGQIAADVRNPFVANAMEIQDNTENRFSGIPTIKLEMKLANLPEPVFYDSKNTFKVTLYNKASANKVSDETNIEQQILNFCKLERTRKELEAQFSTISKAYLFSNFINPLIKSNQLILFIPDKPKSKFQKFKTK